MSKIPLTIILYFVVEVHELNKFYNARQLKMRPPKAHLIYVTHFFQKRLWSSSDNIEIIYFEELLSAV